jgi:hypothetical protein
MDGGFVARIRSAVPARHSIEHLSSSTRSTTSTSCYFSGTGARQTLFRDVTASSSITGRRTCDIHGGSICAYFVEKRRGSSTARVDALSTRRRACARHGSHRVLRKTSASSGGQVSETDVRDLLSRGSRQGRQEASPRTAPQPKAPSLVNYCEPRRISWLDFAVDRNVHKQGATCPASRLEIRDSRGPARRASPTTCLILPWNFRDRRSSRQQRRIHCSRGGRFIVPVPRPQVLEQAPDRAAERPRES